MNSKRSNEVKTQQLGMPIGTASNRLRKLIMFDLLKKLYLNVCYQCGEDIQTEDELSIEHITPWLHSENPTELFFDLHNISFSHLRCNIKAIRPHGEGSTTAHGTRNRYMYHGCRCDECKEAQASYVRNKK